MPKITTPAVGALGFTKSDAAPETPQTRAFASLVTSGMSAPVGAMAETNEAGGLFGGLLSFGAPGDWLDRNFGGGAYGPPDAFGRAAAGVRTIAAFAPIAGEISDFSEVFSGVGPNGEALSGWERGATFVAAGIPFVPAKIAREALGAAAKLTGDALDASKAVGKAPSKALTALAESNITNSGKTVLGHFPGYIDKAKAKGASFFDIGKAWDLLTDAERSAANTHFLEKIAAKGDQVLLSLPKSQIREGSSLADEVEYLIKEKGYRWINQWTLEN
jgi:hypothetical protein